MRRYQPRSYKVVVQNATCIGGNCMAIGSLGQCFDIDASVENVTLTNVTVSPSAVDHLFAEKFIRHLHPLQVIRHNNDLTNSAYNKCWIGVSSTSPVMSLTTHLREASVMVVVMATSPTSSSPTFWYTVHRVGLA